MKFISQRKDTRKLDASIWIFHFNGLGITKDESKTIDYFHCVTDNSYFKAIFNLIYKRAANLGNIAAIQWLKYAYSHKFNNDPTVNS